MSASFLQRDEVLAIFKANLLHAQERMKLNADKSRRDMVFHVDDWVYVRLRPYQQLSLRLSAIPN